MFLSTLLIDTGTNPDRPRPGRLWLRNVYHVHQRLSMAFPTPLQVQQDPCYLQPFNPSTFNGERILFRIDNRPDSDGSRVVILVQTRQLPNWGYAFQNAAMFLAAPPQVKECNPGFEAGDNVQFRIRVNLSKKTKVSTKGVSLIRSLGGVDAKGRPRTQSKRVSLTWDKEQNPDDVIKDWFTRKGVRCGFELNEFCVLNMGMITAWKNKHLREDNPNGGKRMVFRSALLEGTLSVTDAAAFTRTIQSGIGPGKAFGFGLLSVAPLR